MKDQEMLKDDTVYSRYNVHIVSSKTFKDIILRNTFPLVKASRGGYCVKIDGVKIKERRHKLGLSIGKLAEMMGVSKGTIYGYEKNITQASVSAAYKLEKILGVPFVKTINVFESPMESRDDDGFSLGDCKDAGDPFIHLILKKLIRFELKISLVSRAPFDFTADCPQMRFKIIGGIFKRKERYIKERVEEIISLSRIVKAKPLLLGKEKITIPEDVAFLNYDEIAKIGDRKELMRLL